MLAGLAVDAMLLELVVQRAPGDSEHLRRLGSIPVRRSEGFLYRFDF
jgi:hypothetical protein